MELETNIVMAKLTVNKVQREAKMRAHTATHLLHFALDKMLNSTKQAWSLVDDDYLRFDFACKNPIEEWDIQLLESTINDRIKQGIAVITKEMDKEEAQKTSAKAFFEEKYWDIVRIVTIVSEVDNWLDIESVEFCWWTHVNNTAHIGALKIIEHSSVASWIRRIVAVTGTKVIEEAQRNEMRIIDISKRLDCQPKQLEDKLEKILSSYHHLQDDHASLQWKIICTHLDDFHLECSLPSVGSDWWNWCVLNITDTDLSHHDFKEVINAAKSRRSDRNWIIYNKEWNFAIYVGNKGFSAKDFAKQQWLKWWGSDQFVQGKDPKILDVV